VCKSICFTLLSEKGERPPVDEVMSKGNVMVEADTTGGMWSRLSLTQRVMVMRAASNVAAKRETGEAAAAEEGEVFEELAAPAVFLLEEQLVFPGDAFGPAEVCASS